MSLYTSGKETKRGKACSFWHGMLCAQLWLITWRDVSGSDVLWQPRLSYEVDIREKGATCMTFIAHYPFFPVLYSSSISSASHEAKEPFCVNSLIRKTLTCGFRPLFLFILVGKYFIDFCSNRRQAELRGALCGIRLCGGFSGMGGELVRQYVYVCVYVCATGAMSLLITLPLLTL